MVLLSKNNTESLQKWLIVLKEFQLDSIFETDVLARAYMYTKSITPLITEENILECEVSGSSIYRTKITSSNGEVHGSCTCPYDGKCKHLAASIMVSIRR